MDRRRWNGQVSRKFDGQGLRTEVWLPLVSTAQRRGARPWYQGMRVSLSYVCACVHALCAYLCAYLRPRHELSPVKLRVEISHQKIHPVVFTGMKTTLVCIHSNALPAVSTDKRRGVRPPLNISEKSAICRLNYRSFLQNIVCFIGLFCKKDLKRPLSVP